MKGVHIRIAKASAVIEKLTKIWKSDLPNKMKIIFFSNNCDIYIPLLKQLFWAIFEHGGNNMVASKQK